MLPEPWNRVCAWRRTSTEYEQCCPLRMMRTATERELLPGAPEYSCPMPATQCHASGIGQPHILSVIPIIKHCPFGQRFATRHIRCSDHQCFVVLVLLLAAVHCVEPKLFVDVA